MKLNKKLLSIFMSIILSTSLLSGCKSNKNTDNDTNRTVNTEDSSRNETSDKAETQENDSSKTTDSSENSDSSNKPAVDLPAEWSTPPDFDTKKPGVTYGQLQVAEYNSKTTGTVRKCYVMTPPNYSAEKKYPVLYLLHGIGGTASGWLEGEPMNIICNLIASGEASDMIVVMPNVRAMANDGSPKNLLSAENMNAFDNFINDLRNDLMPFIEANYPVSQKREDTAIAGLSMGGRESLFIGFSMLDRFGYIGAFSPAPGLLPYVALNFKGQLTEDQLSVPQNSPEPELILICNGDSDSIVGTIPTLYHNVLTKNGVKHQWYTMPGNHEFKVWKNALYNFTKRIFKH